MTPSSSAPPAHPSAPLPATAAQIEAALHAALAPTVLEVIDESAAHAGHAGANAWGYGSHIRIRIAAPQFNGLSRIGRHRLVYDALRPFIARGLHAVTIETD
ncbi:MAG: BolA family transcriptional regulator [Burkholderiaceae bacterium]|jgi:BolA protein|nr:BolA family transcriptional regulator [Burkholderiaceae bacterium]